MAFVSGVFAGQQRSTPAVCGARGSSFVGAAVAVRPAAVATAPVVAPHPMPVMPEIEAMRHGKRVKKLNKPADQRKAMMRALTTEVIRNGRITSTLERCKAVRKYVDHMITLSKDGSLHARRQALGFIYDKQLVHALFEQGAERYKDRKGGYTRVVRTMPRKGDNASMGIIELI